MTEQIHKHVLENGLTILTKELHHAPRINHWVWYRVGSRNEVPGKTGISHWVEHMQFKGTPRYPIHVLDAEISRVGGFWNAMTYLDWTTYYETLPAEMAGVAIDLERDRMVNSIFDLQETELERTVIISEREGNENDPMFKLSEAVRQAAFSRHPYREQVIGAMDDLRAITRDDLYAHYQRFYTPSNAVIAVAGDFQTADMIDQLAEKYNSLSSAEIQAGKIEPEDKIEAFSKVVVEGPEETVYFELSYRAPSANSQDFFSLMVLDSLLTGPTSLSMFGGGGISNKTSRLYKQVVEKDAAMSISGGLQSTIDPYLYNILAITSPDSDTERIRARIDDEIARLQDSPVSSEEIARAIKQAKALFAYGSESITNQAFWMGYAAIFADHTWFDNFIENLESVTAESVMKAARKYLQGDERVIGIYRPTAGGKR